MQGDFWRQKRVFVTGHTGFQGVWLCHWLKELGAELCGFSLGPPSQPNLHELTRLETRMKSLSGDVRDSDAVSQALKDFQPEIVIHLAAQSLLPLSYERPRETMATNLMGTINLLEAVRHQAKIRAVLVVTSDKCYQRQGNDKAHQESDPLGGDDPYSASKAAAEIALQAYRRCYFSSPSKTVLASARTGNVLGGGDWGAGRLVPDILRALEEKVPISLRAPNSIRPWQHVLDALHGYLLLLEKMWSDGLAYGEAWNFGPAPDNPYRAQWIAKALCRLWGETELPILHERPSFAERDSLMLDASAAQERLGWRPLLDLEETLEWVVAWHRDYLKKANLQESTLRQIRRFQERVAR